MTGSRRAVIGRHGGQLARFGGVGFVCAAIDFGLFAAFVWFGAPPVAANAASFLAANVVGYLLNGRLTFRRKDAPLSLRGYGKYFSAYAASLVLSTVVIAVLAGRIGPLPAKVIATGAGAIWNYLFSALVVFRAARSEEDPAA